MIEGGLKVGYNSPERSLVVLIAGRIFLFLNLTVLPGSYLKFVAGTLGKVLT